MEKDPMQGIQQPGPDQNADRKAENDEQVKIKVLGITLIEAKKVSVKLIILVAVVLTLSIVLAWVLKDTIRPR